MILRSRRTPALLALIVSVSLWGTPYGAVALVLDQVPPMTLAFLRVALALAVILPLTIHAGHRPARGMTPLLLGLVGTALFIPLQNAGMHFTSAGNAVMVFAGAVPVFTVLLAWVVLRESLTRRQLAGVVLSIVGVIVIVTGGSMSSLSFAVAGDSLILGSALCSALFTVLGRHAFVTGNLFAVMSGSMCYALLLMLPFTSGELARATFPTPSMQDVLIILYLGIGVSGLGLLLFSYSLRHLPAGHVAVIGNLDIVAGMVFAVIVLHEIVVGSQVIGGMLVLASIWLVTTIGSNASSANANSTHSHVASVANDINPSTGFTHQPLSHRLSPNRKGSLTGRLHLHSSLDD